MAGKRCRGPGGGSDGGRLAAMFFAKLDDSPMFRTQVSATDLGS